MTGPVAVLAVLVVAFGVATVLERAGVPSGALMGAMTAVVVLRLLLGDLPTVPSPVRFVAYVLIGWGIGEKVTRAAVAALRESLRAIAVAVVGLFVSAALAGVLLWRAAGWSADVTILAAAPGGVSHLAALAVALGADPIHVTAYHLLRVLTIVVTAPIAMRILPTGHGGKGLPGSDV